MDNFKTCYHRTHYVGTRNIAHAWYYINTSEFNGVHFHVWEDTQDNKIIVGGIEMHSFRPFYSTDERPISNCFVTGFKPCYCDGSLSWGISLFEEFNNDLQDIIQNPSKVFDRLKIIYHEQFEEKEKNDANRL